MWCAIMCRRRGRNVAGRGSASGESMLVAVVADACSRLGAGFMSGSGGSGRWEGRGTEERNGDTERGRGGARPRYVELEGTQWWSGRKGLVYDLGVLGVVDGAFEDEERDAEVDCMKLLEAWRDSIEFERRK